MIKKLASNRLFVICCALFCCALWGISTPIMKMGYRYMDQTHIPSLFLWAGAQFLLSGLLSIGVYSIASRKFVTPKKASIKGVVIVSVLQTVLQYAFLYIGLSRTSSVKGAILKSTDVFFVVLIASLLFRTEKLTLKKLLACIVGFSGIVIMNLDGLQLQLNPVGDGLVLLAIVTYSFSVVVTKLFTQQEDPITLCGYQMSLGGVVLALIGIAFGGKCDFAGMLPIFLCLALIYGVSYSLWTILLKYNPASGVTIYSFVTPVFGVVFSWLMLSEDANVALVNLILALVLVCGGILIWGYEKKPR